MDIIGKIYKLLCNDGYYYIGSTINSLNDRYSAHKNKSKKSNNKLYKHINTIGWENVKIELLEEIIIKNNHELLIKESEYIVKELSNPLCLNTQISYNINKEHNNNIGRIYKLVCNDGYFYIGSTIQTLNKRLTHHKQDSKRLKLKLYKHINTIGWENVKMELLEELTINNRKELLNKEGEYIRKEFSNLCLNMVTPPIDAKESEKESKRRYREKNKEKIKEKDNIYKENNKEKVKESKKRYKDNNKEKVKIASKIYNDKMKDKYKDYRDKHKEKNKQYLKEYYEKNKEINKLKAKEYYEKNKEHIKLKAKEYYEKNKGNI